MLKLYDILLTAILALLPLTVTYGQSVIGNEALSSNQNRKSSSLSSTIYAPGTTGVAFSSRSFTSDAGNFQVSAYDVSRMKTFSPSGSNYSSSIQTPFASKGPKTLRRDNDDDDLPGEPGNNPGDPGDPMPLGNGIWLLMLFLLFYTLIKTHQLKHHTQQTTQNTNHTRNITNMKTNILKPTIIVLLLFFAGVGESWGYYYRGEKNSWGATAMTASDDGLYDYYYTSGTHQFKISNSASSWDYNYSYVSKGFNGTNVTEIGDYGKDNCYCWKTGNYYIIVYYPNKYQMNTTSKPIICASTNLPKQTWYIKHPWNGGSWTWIALAKPPQGLSNYTYEGKWGNNGCNVNTGGSDTNCGWIEKTSISGYSTFTTGDNVIFTYNPKTNSLSVTDKTYSVTVASSSTTMGTVSASSVTAGKYTYSATVTATAKTGYEFIGWTATTGITITSPSATSTTIKATQTGTLTANFRAKTYTITLNKNGGKADKTVTATYNSNILTGYSAVERDNYGLDGYYTSASGGSKVIDASGNLVSNISGYTAVGRQWIMNSNTTLYAHWLSNVYVTYNGNGATSGNVPTDANSYVPDGSHSATVLDNIGSLSRTGYTWSGWNTMANGSGTSYSAGNTINPITSNMTLYAKWAEILSTLTTSNHYDAGSPEYANPTKSVSSIGISTTSTITATNPGSGYVFAGWTLSSNIVVTSGNPATDLTITIRTNGNGAAATAQANYTEDLSTEYVLKGGTALFGDATGWSVEHPFTKKAGEATGSVAYLEVPITTALTGDAGNENYNFKIVKKGASDTWYGLTGSGDWWYDSSKGQQTLSTTGNNIQLRANVVGTYIIKLDYTTPASPKITITWPTALQIYCSNPNDAVNVGDHQWDNNDGTTYVWSIDLDANTTYEFKINDKGSYYGYDANEIKTTISATTFATGTSNTRLVTKSAGTFVFTWNSSTHKLAIQYPKSAFLSASPDCIYTGEMTTLTGYASELGSGSHTIQYEFFKGTELTNANKIATKSNTVNATYQSVTQDVTVDFADNTSSQIYTVRISEGGSIIATNTVTIYRKWDIYVHDTQDWGGIYNYMWATSRGEYAAWPGVSSPKYNGNNTWYTVTLDSRYTYFQLNCNECSNHKRTFGGDGAYRNDIATYPEDSYWYLDFHDIGGDGNHYYTLGTIAPTLPTVTLTTGLLTTTAIELVGYMSNCGGDGLTAAEMKHVWFTVNGVNYEAQCMNGAYFYLTLTGLTPGTTYTVSASATNIIGTYTTATQNAETRSGYTLVKVKNQMEWMELNLYAYADTGNDCGESDIHIQHDYEMTPLGYDNWYYAYVSNDYTHFKVNNGPDWTEVGVEIEADCYTNKYNNTNNTLGKTTCPSLNLYQIEIIDGDNIYHSNTIDDIADTLSFYAQKDATITLIYFNGSNVKRTNISSSFSSYTEGDVVIAKVASVAGTNLTGISRYTGSFYVRTDGKTGTWNDYKDGGKTMTKFENKKDLYPNEYYNHYWCQYFGEDPWKNINIKAQVANDYNSNLSTTLPSYVLPKQSNSNINWGTNVRFAYNNNTNLFEVKRLQAANLGDFLQIYGFANDGDNARNYAYKDAACTNKLTSGNTITMSDLSDWQYQADFYIQAPGNDKANIDIRANYFADGVGNGVSHLYLGGTDETEPAPFLVMGNTTTAGTYLIRVIYDYKTNRLIAAWLPYDDMLPNGILDANMMIIRTDDTDAKTVGVPNNNRTLSKVHKVYGVLEINKETYRTKKNSGNMFYWISLPFDVKVKDIFGIDGYGTKWTIQRYRSDLRAQNGYHEGQTYWRNMNNLSETATMEAGRGYVVYLNLNPDADFSNVTYIDENEVTQTKALKRLYFPSDNTTDYTLKYDNTVLHSTFPTNICSLPGRRNQDSNWYIAGVPGYNESTITSPTSLPADAPALDSASSPIRFFYEYQWGHADKKDNYVPTSVSGYKFKPFYSYMFQYAGDVAWSRDISTNVMGMPGRREIATHPKQRESLLQINLDDDNGHLDRTFVNLSEADYITEGFDMNTDLSKIVNHGSQIYSLAGEDMLAGNAVPYDQEVIPLGLIIEEDGTYTFNLEDVDNDVIAYLVDKATSNRTCLLYNDYEVALDAGRYDGRFYLELAHAPSVVTTTQTQSGAEPKIALTADRLFIDGISSDTEVRIYDVTGRLVSTAEYNSGIGIPAPPAGVYLLALPTSEPVKFVVR